jgi:malonate-semialdehyde dehydrogenase (acetylating) / methylmalonate-semialdehyde dehydrogenase
VSALVEIPDRLVPCLNFVGGNFVAGSGPTLEVRSPYTGAHIGELRVSSAADVARAVQAAALAFPGWRATPLRERVEPLLKLRALLLAELPGLSQTVALESGKTPDEARAGLMRGIEVIDFAASLPNFDQGGARDVSRGVSCEYRREPLGVVVGITPFNFPLMVPLWMIPVALTTGNCFILKPSEKVPLSACRLAELAQAAGYPPGVFSVVHGDAGTVMALAEHPEVRALGFVGSSRAAEAVYARAASSGKRALCLGGAKNQMIVAPDADPRLTVKTVVDSFTGCAGQRCMAGSLLVAVAEAERFIGDIRDVASRIQVGRDMGAIIDKGAAERIVKAIEGAEREGAHVLLDGRGPHVPEACSNGSWVGPTVLDHVRPDMHCAQDEIFGPVLSVIRVPTLEAALELERMNPYGNATSVFTSSGAVARLVSERSSSGMIGVNVGVPVPREPFGFGGTKRSKFGHGDITGPDAVDFWTDLKKITVKWMLQPDATWMS